MPLKNILLFLKAKIIDRHKILSYSILTILIFYFLLFLSTIIFPIPKWLNRDFSKTYYYSDQSVCWISLNDKKQYRVKAELDDISKYIVKGVIEYEDRSFFMNPGFNPVSIIRAFFVNIRAKRVLYGGSTITMQLARLSEPKRRSVKNKLLEVMRAIQLELLYSKREILALYLNTIPMGGNIQGVEAASYFYFGKRAGELTFGEASLLLGISNSPEKNRPDKNIVNAKSGRDKVAKRIAAIFDIDDYELDRIVESEPRVSKQKFDSNIISIVERVEKSNSESNIHLTLDRNIQELSNRILTNHLIPLKSTNCALIVIDNESMDTLAYLGSPFYEKNVTGSRYNACNIRRSPGSTLKPFIYAMGIERGIVTPKLMLIDIPIDFNGYNPKNFSQTYYGIISADEALYRSLNIPAISLERSLGEMGLKSFLLKSGYMSNKSEVEDSDLSIVLGSYPLTLENIVELYSSLSNDGILNKLNFLKSDLKSSCDEKEKLSLISKEACYITNDILSQGFRPDLDSSWEYTKDKVKIAYKTGTSYGYLDALAIGYTPKYTVGVWVGNLDNKLTFNITGAIHALPVVFKILNELGRVNDRWFDIPSDIAKREVCAVSGKLPTKFCKAKIDDFYIKGKTNTEYCDIHKKVIYDKSTKKIVSIKDIDETESSSNYEEIVMEVYPNFVEHYLKKSGKYKQNNLSGNFSDIDLGSGLNILSPKDGSKYQIDLSSNVEYQKIELSANNYLDSNRFYWYANDKFIGSIPATSPLFFIPEDKNIEISLVDEKGRSASVSITVDFVKYN